MSKTCKICELDIEEYQCHYCHEGDDTFDFYNSKWEKVYLNKLTDKEEGIERLVCKKCKTEYYKSWYYGDGSVGCEEWKILTDGTRIDKHKPRDEKNPYKPLECNY